MGAPGTTPGKWRVEADMRSERGNEYLAGWNICGDGFEVVGCEGIIPGAWAEKDAHQIAASGALYDALAGLLEGLRLWSDGQFARRCPAHMQDAENALAQARGEVSVHTLEGGL